MVNGVEETTLGWEISEWNRVIVDQWLIARRRDCRNWGILEWKRGTVDG
jgi:hypothetical protein